MTDRRGAESPEWSDLARDLRREMAGEVRFDPLARVLYSTDASLYQIEPVGVVQPRGADDVVAAVSVCRAHGVPIVARAGGSSLVGQCLGRGVVVDFSVHMHEATIEPEARIALAQPGTVLDELNRLAARHGLTFGPDPASSDRACIGGVVANNGSGAHSAVYGMAADHVRSVEVVMADGSQARLGRFDAAQVDRRVAASDALGVALATLRRIATEEATNIRDRFPKYWRRAGGYNLDRLAAADDGVVDAAGIFAGSEGSLAIATRLELSLVPLPARRGLLVASFPDPIAAFRAVPALLATDPTAIEVVDDVLLGLAREAYGDRAGFALGDKSGEAMLLVEYSGHSESAVRGGCASGRLALTRSGHRGSVRLALAEPDMARIWATRKAAVGLLMRMRGDWKPVPGIEDTAVPPHALAEYIAEVGRLVAERGLRAAYYGHASSGCIHIRPILNVKTVEGIENLVGLTASVGDLARRFGGVQSAEHGDGLARGSFNERQFGPDMYRLMLEVKSAFDPDGLFNPGKVVNSPPADANLRYGRHYDPLAPPARYVYPEDGDLVRAVEQCNGSAVCRKLDAGTMCPSYMVTRDELHTTRARANTLRAVLDGRLGQRDLANEALWQAMSLCVACKACRTECPSGVDMARLKAEVAAARIAEHGASMRARLFANLNRIDRAVGPLAPVANVALRGAPARIGSRALGIAPQRRLPAVAHESFDAWWHRRAGATGSQRGRSDPYRLVSGAEVEAGQDGAGGGASAGPTAVVLFADTISTFHEPAIARAAVSVLEAAGYGVIVPRRWCCGRPALSQGLIELAVRDMRANVRVLGPLARAGMPILVPEPSCASALREDMPDLLAGLPEAEDGRSVASCIQTLEEFVAAIPADRLHLLPRPGQALLHVHCHQRSAVGVGPAMATLGRIPGLAVTEPDAGCCGMAGAFGYEAEHYEISIAMAERRLAPAVRALAAGTLVVAPGASCRQQIAHTTGRQAVHPIEVLASCLE